MPSSRSSPPDAAGDAVSPAVPRRALTLFDATSIIVGIIIGAGIYQTTPAVAMRVGGVLSLLAVWIAGGMLATLGALCYAELACAFPEDGGDYVYLRRAFGRRAAFVFAWCELWVVRPGSMGAMAFIFALYANQLYPLASDGPAPCRYAAGAILALSAVNMLGVRQGKWTQNILTLAKVIGLLALFGVAFAGPGAAAASPRTVATAPETDYPLALIMVLFTYGGWSDVAYVAAEVRNPQRNLLASLLCGIGLVTGIYLLANLAFIYALGLSGLQSSPAAAADVLALRWGAAGGRAISVLVCLSTLGAINGQLFTGARIYYALGADHALFRRLGRWNARLGAPLWSLALQAAATLAAVLAVGSHADGFERLVIFSTPVYWFFFLAVGLAFFVLRGGGRPRAFRAPCYPWTPIAFCLLSVLMICSSVAYAYQHRTIEWAWALGVLAAGVLASLLLRSPPGGENTSLLS